MPAFRTVSMLGLLMVSLSACNPAAPQAAEEAASDVKAADAAPASSDAATGAQKRAAGEESQPMAALRAFGTEPFWNVEASGGKLVFSTPEDIDGRTLAATAKMDGDTVIHTGNEGALSYTLTIKPGDCNDGMSDNDYHMTSTFDLGDAHYTGCAEPAK